MEASFFSLKNIWHEIRSNRANQITLSRIVSTSVGNILLYFDIFPPIVLILYAWNFASDALDGWLARIDGPSDFGKGFDPVADKYLFFSTAYFMWRSFQSPVISEFYLTTFLKALLCLDLSLLAFGLAGALLGLELASNWFGKKKMITECIIMGLWVIFYLTLPLRYYLYNSILVLTVFQILFLIAIPLAFLSLVLHFWDQRSIFWEKIKYLFHYQ